MSIPFRILWKDVQCLRLEIATSLALLLLVTTLDILRSDAVPGPAEGMLNLLLAAAWALLIGRLVLQDPLTGDQQFWVTRPYGKGRLFIAKLLFPCLIIHLPVAIAHVVILTSHGFSIGDALATLAQKQGLLLAGLTLPCLAIASICRRLTQYAVVVLLAGAGIALITQGDVPGADWMQESETRRRVALVVITGVSIAMLALSYGARRILSGRIIGATGALAATGFLVFLPTSAADRLRCRFSAGSTAPAVELSEPSQKLAMRMGLAGAPFKAFLIPVQVTGLDSVQRFRNRQLSLTIKGKDGSQWKPAVRGAPAAGLFTDPSGAIWQTISLTPKEAVQAEQSPVNIVGSSVLNIDRGSPAVRIPLDQLLDRRVRIAGLGICSAAVVGEAMSRQMLRILCESSRPIPFLLEVRLSGGNQAWRHQLDDARTRVAYPDQSWLSPLHRRQTFFHLVEETSGTPDSFWLVERRKLEGASIEIVPRTSLGCALVNYTLPNVRLTDYRVN
jgi:hypothetical protein